MRPLPTHPPLSCSGPRHVRDASFLAGDRLALPLPPVTRCEIAFEYIACQQKNNGVLILSEFVGAAQTLGSGALLVNPFNTDEASRPPTALTSIAITTSAINHLPRLSRRHRHRSRRPRHRPPSPANHHHRRYRELRPPHVPAAR